MVTYQVDILEPKGVQAILEELFDSPTMVEPTNEYRLVNGYHSTEATPTEVSSSQTAPPSGSPICESVPPTVSPCLYTMFTNWWEYRESMTRTVEPGCVEVPEPFLRHSIEINRRGITTTSLSKPPRKSAQTFRVLPGIFRPSNRRLATWRALSRVFMVKISGAHRSRGYLRRCSTCRSCRPWYLGVPSLRPFKYQEYGQYLRHEPDRGCR